MNANTDKIMEKGYKDLIEIIQEKDKEIERLNKECDTYMKIATKRGNLINEIRKGLEDWLEVFHGTSYKEDKKRLESILDKLKEEQCKKKV